MKKILVLLVLTLFLTNFIIAQAGITSYVTENEDAQDNPTRIQSRVLTQTQVQEIKQERKRIRIQEGECAENCTCTSSTVKCELENGGRIMTITAGRSGNIIVQVKGINASTTVTLYKSEGKVYGEFRNKTKEVRVMPDMARSRVRKEIERQLEEEEIELGEDAIYTYKAKKRVKLLGFIRTRVRVRAEINSETGELIKIRHSWWTFLTSDDSEPLNDVSCETVSSDSRNQCCIDEGYDLYNTETDDCEFSSE